jgi:hypothetical protein
MSPPAVRSDWDPDLVEVVKSEVGGATAQRLERNRLAGEEQEEHAPRLAADDTLGARSDAPGRSEPPTNGLEARRMQYILRRAATETA